MDIRLLEAAPTAEERGGGGRLLGPPRSAWDGGARGSMRDRHVAHGGPVDAATGGICCCPRCRRCRRAWAGSARAGLAYVCERLDVPPADAWGVATFYALLSTTPRAKRVLHVCDDIACKCRGADALIEELERKAGPAHAHAPDADHVRLADDASVWVRSPCLGMCEHGAGGAAAAGGPRAVRTPGGRADRGRGARDAGRRNGPGAERAGSRAALHRRAEIARARRQGGPDELRGLSARAAASWRWRRRSPWARSA